LKSKVTYIAKKEAFMEGHKRAFFNQEAAGDDLVKALFRDKSQPIKRLFEIDEGRQYAPKSPQKAVKSGEKKKCSFFAFCASKVSKGDQAA
jgi:hypothetical protein